MNASSSECSSGCDSGWTLYFQPSSPSSSSDGYGNDDNNNSTMLPFGIPENGKKDGFHDEEEEEDLSMVSDASSGPPPVHYQAPCWSTSPKARKDFKRQKMNKQQGQCTDHLRSTLLHDTASSPAIINNHYVWKGSAGKSGYQEQHHIGFLPSQNNIAATGGHDNQLGGLG